ncbi:MAG TPA: PAS domain-containing protein [Acidisoma sp.]|uniref:PAS domain-containing protein n=1 Tax=Acidisoma sp. TaxID=1872115 RepID=UPI002C6A7A12|nr:PAS domain-containing protein [Acidisoma sp.]HTI01263.1 PAS domain-containing protein [Acidisoma sp.]
MTSDPIPTLLRDYFERSSIALALAHADDDHPLVLVNAGFQRLTGYPSEEVIGRNCRMMQRGAENRAARDKIHPFLRQDQAANLRTPIVNFRKNGTPFVNLLYMSKLRSPDRRIRFIFASQFDISRSQPDLLADYDAELGSTLTRLSPVLAESGIIIEGSLLTIANTAALIAQAKLTLAEASQGQGE